MSTPEWAPWLSLLLPDPSPALDALPEPGPALARDADRRSSSSGALTATSSSVSSTPALLPAQVKKKKKKSKTPLVPINPLTSGKRMRGRKKSAIIVNLRPGAPPPAPLPHGAYTAWNLPTIPAPDRESAPPVPRLEERIEAESHAANEEEKRRRNTLASARFRIKKKAREAALEEDARWLRQRQRELTVDNVQLERENTWLRTGLVGKDPVLFKAVASVLPQAAPGAAVDEFAEQVGAPMAARHGAPLPPPAELPLLVVKKEEEEEEEEK